MFLGHYGLGFGAKKLTPSVSLGVLFAASQFADLLWPTLVLLGVEKVQIDPGITVVTPLNFVSYPYSHSLEGLVIWGVLFGLVYWLIRRSRLSAAVVVAALVVSHWVLDAIVHRADLPLTFHGSTRVGLGIWYSLPATIFVEGVIFAAGVLGYTQATRARDRIGSIGFWSLVGFLAVVYVANLFGPPPPSSTAVAWAAEAMWLLVAWGYWVDKHRSHLSVRA
jgi:FtsH-binding integral membrane protein